MGHIMSVEEAISDITWTKLPKGRPMNVEKAMSLGDGSVLLKLANGTYALAGRHHSPDGPYSVIHYSNRTVLNGLVRMGVLTKEQVKSHLDAVKASKEKQDRKWAMSSLRQACEKLGIEVPKVPEV